MPLKGNVVNIYTRLKEILRELHQLEMHTHPTSFETKRERLDALARINDMHIELVVMSRNITRQLQ
jgi:hypothetical protein